MRQGQPIHRAGHLDVGEDGTDFRVLFQNANGLPGRPSLESFEAAALQRLHEIEPYKQVVFDD
jgi:hypothetical protein